MSSVDVIVVNFNSGSALEACIDTLQASESRFRIVVVDNNSSDGSTAFLNHTSGEKPVRLINNRENVGFARAVNLALAETQSDYVLLLNPDCQVGRSTVSRLASTLDEASECGIAGGLVFGFDGKEQTGCRRREPTPERSVKNMLGRWLARFASDGVDLTLEPVPSQPVRVDAVSGALLMARREAIEAAGGMDEGYFLHVEDLDICRTIRDAGWSVLFEPRASALHLGGVSGGTSRLTVEWRKHRGMQRYFSKHYQTELSALKLSGLHALILGHFLIRAAGSLVTHLKTHTGDQASTETRAPRARCRREPPKGNSDVAAGRLLILGGRTDVGKFLIDKAVRADNSLMLVTRSSRAGSIEGSCWWVNPEYFRKAPDSDISPAENCVSLMPIWLLRKHEDIFVRLGVKRIVALSSTSVEAKRDSDEASERRTVSLLADGEAWLERFAHEHGIKTTVLRPTLIYGGPQNKNVAKIGKFIKRFGFVPLVRPATGLRQPVHAEDLASACLAVLACPETIGKTYDVPGGLSLPYREMVDKIFQKHDQKPRYLWLSVKIMRSIVKMMTIIPALRYLTPSMVDRVNRDLVFSADAAREDFGWEPRSFSP